MNQLTKREQEVYSLLAEGLSDKQIAERLEISPKTAETHSTRVLRKLGISRRNDILVAIIQKLQEELEEKTTRLSWLETCHKGGMEAIRVELARLELTKG